MTSQSTPNTSKLSGDELINVEGESTGAEKQAITNSKKKRGIGVVTGWLRMVEPRKVPYFPQNKDKIVYLRQAHEHYLKEVIDRKIYKVKESDKLWIAMKIDVFEFLTITKISFKKYPTRVACLEVRRINQEDQAIGPVFKLKYHDMGDVVDFLVLKHDFNEGLNKKWKIGDRFRCLVGNDWFFGTIKSIEPYEKEYPESPFNCFKIKWDDETELDQLSPWELEVINKNRLPKNPGEYVRILSIETVKMRYNPDPDDWPGWEDRKVAIKKILSELDLLMDLPISKCFIEIKNDPVYDALVSYPIDLSTIRERFEKQFYRRIESVKMDIYYLKYNAEQATQFSNSDKGDHSQIKKKRKRNKIKNILETYKSQKFFEEAQLITQICEYILNDKDSTSLFSELREFLKKDFNSSDSDDGYDDDNEYKPTGNKKARPPNSKNNWRSDCERMLNILSQSEDMFPFRQPVCREDYPDYYEMIKSPICLEEIMSKFQLKLYKEPKQVFDDIKLLISNSKQYNRDSDKAIYNATIKISNLFEDLKKQINYKKILESPKARNENQIDSKNGQIAINSNDTRLASGPRPVVQNLFTPKKNIQEKNIDGKLVQSINEENSNQSSKSNIDVQSIQNNEDNLLQENSNKNYACSNKVNNNNTSKFDHNDSEIIENNANSQLNVTPQSSITLQSERNDSTDSIIVIDIEDDDAEEQQTTSGNFEAVNDLIQSHSTETSEQDVSNTNALQKKSNLKKSLASIKARKRMQYRYKNIFQPRPCKSCDICQSIKRTYLSHVQTHHT